MDGSFWRLCTCTCTCSYVPLKRDDALLPWLDEGIRVWGWWGWGDGQYKYMDYNFPLGGPPSQVLPKACITHRRKVLRVHVNCCRALMPTLKGVHAHAYTRLQTGTVFLHRKVKPYYLLGTSLFNHTLNNSYVSHSAESSFDTWLTMERMLDQSCVHFSVYMHTILFVLVLVHAP